jgi:hypothetical protein
MRHGRSSKRALSCRSAVGAKERAVRGGLRSGMASAGRAGPALTGPRYVAVAGIRWG